MSAQAGWFPDPGGGAGLYRYWDGRAWSAATSANPMAAPPQGLIGSPNPPAQPPTAYGAGGSGSAAGWGQGSQPLGGAPSAPGQTPLGGTSGYGGGGYGSGAYGAGGVNPTPGAAYANYQQQTQKKRSAVGWWVGGGVLLVVLAIVTVLVVRNLGGGAVGPTPGPIGGGPSQDVCPAPQDPTSTPDPVPPPTDGRVHGGPISYPLLGSPWDPPTGDNRVPFGRDVKVQDVAVQTDYDGRGNSWVASVLVAELAAGDGFFSPEQGSVIVVKCIIGTFYSDATVKSDVKTNKAITVDGHEAWLVESHLSFDIEGLDTKGELLIVVIVSAGASSGLYYASIPDTIPELVQPARDLIGQLKVDG